MFMGDASLETVKCYIYQWDHPLFGTIKEATCGEHAIVLPLLLQGLGIGYSRTEADDKTVCIRCFMSGVPVKDWIHEYATST